VAGALAERAFADKLDRAGFCDVVMGDRRPFGIDDVASYPLFTPELLELMRRSIAPDRQDRVAVSVVATARKPAARNPAARKPTTR
jgi:arsenite methyltransferase